MNALRRESAVKSVSIPRGLIAVIVRKATCSEKTKRLALLLVRLFIYTFSVNFFLKILSDLTLFNCAYTRSFSFD